MLGAVETFHLNSWGEFAEIVETIRSIHKPFTLDDTNLSVNPRILYRGQARATWPVLTTLERRTDKRYHILKWLLASTRHAHEIESFTGERWDVPSYPELKKEISETQGMFRVSIPAYSYLLYLRHHSFPSLLLDWTESPYIAAFF